MKSRIVQIGAALAFGLAALASVPASAAPAGLASALPQAALPAASALPVEEVNHHRWRRGGGGSITFHFGAGPRYYGPRHYYGPRYHAPRYYQPRYSHPPYAQPRYHRRAPVNAHVGWCASRYKSYRARDNSFQPYSGPRRQCVSPFM